MLPPNAHSNCWRAGGLLVLCLLALCTGCQTAAPPFSLEASARRWPPSPATSRIHHLGAAGKPSDLGARISMWNRVVNTVTGSQRGKETWVRPFGLCVDEEDNLCMADAGTGQVHFYDKRSRKYRQWGKVGDVLFQVPVSVAKRAGILYVADTGLGAVIAFNLKGKKLLEIREPIQRPAAVLAYRDILVVADSKAHCLHAFDLQGNYLRSYGQRGEELGAFNFPTHLATDATGNLYVTDSMNFRVQVFDSGFRPMGSFGQLGQATGQFNRPKGVGVDNEGHIYVADTLFDNVQVFDQKGRFLMHWGEAGHEIGSFWMPAGVAIDSQNTIYVADSYNKRIQLFQYKELP